MEHCVGVNSKLLSSGTNTFEELKAHSRNCHNIAGGFDSAMFAILAARSFVKRCDCNEKLSHQVLNIRKIQYSLILLNLSLLLLKPEFKQN